MEKIQHQSRVEGYLRLLPEWITLTCILGRCVLDEIIDKPENVRVLSDIAEGIVAVRFRWVDEIEDLYHITRWICALTDATWTASPSGGLPMPDNCSILIDRIIELRKASGMTQRDLAKAANLAQPAIARLESKSAMPQLDTLLKVLSALGQQLEVVPLE